MISDICKLRFFWVRKKLDSLWCLKSRIKWVFEGEKNTRFYQTMATCHFRNSHISKLNYNGAILSKLVDVKTETRQYFAELFKWQEECKFSFHGILFHTLSSDQAGALIVDFTPSEIFEGLNCCSSSKFPGPDSFNFLFTNGLGQSLRRMFLLSFLISSILVKFLRD